MKKYLALSLVFATLLTLSACKDDATDKNTDNTDQATQTEDVTKSGDKVETPADNSTTNSDTAMLSEETVIIETDKGTIKLALYPEVTNTTANFKKLITESFYNGLTFHRVVPGFVVQGGDPNGDGTGGSEESVDLEIPCTNGVTISGKIADDTCQVKYPHKKGVLAMARSASPNSASSQFYITLEEQKSLDRKYTVFGEVVEGMDVVEQIAQGDTMTSVVIK